MQLERVSDCGVRRGCELEGREGTVAQQNGTNFWSERSFFPHLLLPKTPCLIKEQTSVPLSLPLLHPSCTMYVFGWNTYMYTYWLEQVGWEGSCTVQYCSVVHCTILPHPSSPSQHIFDKESSPAYDGVGRGKEEGEGEETSWQNKVVHGIYCPPSSFFPLSGQLYLICSAWSHLPEMTLLPTSRSFKDCDLC